MTQILLIRHADNPSLGKFLASRMSGVHLNDPGKIQAQELAETLKDLPIAAIFSSPLERAIETAQPLSDQLHLPIQIHEGLHEIDYGELQGKPIQEIRRSAIWAQIRKDPTAVHLPGGESYLQAQNRLREALEEIRQAYPQDGQMVACFTHADTIRLGLAYYSGAPITSFNRYTIDTASITCLELRDPLVGLRFINLQVPVARNFLTLKKD